MIVLLLSGEGKGEIREGTVRYRSAYTGAYLFSSLPEEFLDNLPVGRENTGFLSYFKTCI